MGALESMRVLDMTQYEAGTSCTQALGFMGATVTKIERPGTGDPGRGVARGTDNAPYFLNWNSNKRSIALDLQSEAKKTLPGSCAGFLTNVRFLSDSINNTCCC